MPNPRRLFRRLIVRKSCALLRCLVMMLGFATILWKRTGLVRKLHVHGLRSPLTVRSPLLQLPSLAHNENFWHKLRQASRLSSTSYDESEKSTILLEGLNPSQVQAVTQPLRWQDPQTGDSTSIVTRVIAGPGSGKTKVLTTRIAHLLQEDPYGKILAVTFTRKAAGEMKERLERLLRELDTTNHHPYEMDHSILQESSDGHIDEEGSKVAKGIERVELGTFHSICAKILRFNGESLRDLPSVQRDMSKAQPQWVENLSEEGGVSEKILVDPEINLNGQYVIIDQSEQIRILNECLKFHQIDLKTTEVKPIQVLSTIGTIKEKFAQGEDPFQDQKKNGSFRGVGKTMEMARKAYFPYREKLLMNNALDFDDLILLTRELLMEDNELRERLHRRWPHVLVDEYQDTSKIQMDLIKLLTSSSLFVVGDADQSIYSWRGAHVKSLQDVKTEFEAYGTVQTVFLKENYRSTSNIVRAAEKVISSSGPAPPRKDKAPIEDGMVQEEDKTQDSTNELRRAMQPKRGSGPSPRVVACADERAEAKFVVDTIQDMLAKGEITSSDTVAMIYRTNAQSRYLEEACVQNNLPYVIRGGAGGFYKRTEIKDCLCFLRWLYNGNDEGSMLRAMKTPSKGIGEKGYKEFKDYCELVQSYMRQNFPDDERPTYLDILVAISNDEGTSDRDKFYVLPSGSPLPGDHISKRALNNFVKFSRTMREIRAKAYKAPVGSLLLFLIEELKLIDHFDSISKSKTEFLERKENVQELRNAAKKYASYGPSLAHDRRVDHEDGMGSDSALADFLDDVALVSDTAEANEDNDKENARLVVNLMTIHASKGTEFDCVFVVGLEEGTLPCQPALQEGSSIQLEEEKRLCYVAMTRAKTRLILTWRNEVTSFTNWSSSGPKTQEKSRSRFLDAIVSKKSKKAKSKAGPSSRADKTPKRSSRFVDRSGLKGGYQRREISSSATRRSTNPRLSVNRSATPRPERARAPPKKLTPPRKSSSAPPLSSHGPSQERIEAMRSNLRSKPKSAPRPVATKDAVDPMWFFPVGIKVVHMNLGKGTVVEPPPFQTIEDAKVRVRFENGKTLEFPALGSDIVPDMGGIL